MAKYWKAVFGDIILVADSHEEANNQLDDKIARGEVPILSVEEVTMTDEEVREYLEDQGDLPRG